MQRLGNSSVTYDIGLFHVGDETSASSAASFMSTSARQIVPPPCPIVSDKVSKDCNKRARRLDAPLLIYCELNALGCLVLEDFALLEIAIFFGLLFRDIADEVDMKETDSPGLH